MQRKTIITLFSLLLVILTTVSVASAASDYILFNDLIITKPRTSDNIASGDSFLVQLGYRFVDEPGVASSMIVGFSEPDCAGDKWLATPVSSVATQQATALTGTANLTLVADQLTSATKSVSVEVRLKETNYEAADRLVSFYCLNVGSDGESNPTPSGPSNPMPGVSATPAGGSITSSTNISADVYYQIGSAGHLEVSLLSLPVSCNQINQIDDPEFFPFASEVILRDVTAASGTEQFTLQASEATADTKSVMFNIKVVEDDGDSDRWILMPCFDLTQ